ncbi:hypothetical protein BH11MYX1_BH11MYX1_20180 [soil metagenome]
MRALRTSCFVILLPALGFADPVPDQTPRGNEIIEIHDHVPPKVLPKPHFDTRRIAPYSSAAILRDAWTRAWLLLDVDANGVVTRFKFLNRPGYDLEPIATKEAFTLRFAPALDAMGRNIPTEIIVPMEWPSHGWLMMFYESAARMPPDRGFPPRSPFASVPCAGSGPWEFSSMYRTYRDCSGPKRENARTEPWIARPRP